MVTIADSGQGHRYAYSPPTHANTTQFIDDESRTFTGPRTVITLLGAAAASFGEILPIDAPYNRSRYSTEFYGPIVNCSEASDSKATLINGLFNQNMQIRVGTARQVDSAYYAFVPGYNASGQMIALSDPRDPQTHFKSSNELWMTFLRFVYDAQGNLKKERHYQVCELHNATYDITIEWDKGVQMVNGTYKTMEAVPFPHDGPDDVSNMAQHAYSAFFWVLTDQLVGQMSWYQDVDAANQHYASRPPQFGVIDTPLQRTALLGSSDLDVFFNFDAEKGLFKIDNEPEVSTQRLQDKLFAKNRTLDVMIQELSFNMTVSLMHNKLLT